MVMDYFIILTVTIIILALVMFIFVLKKSKKVNLDQKALDKALNEMNEDEIALERFVNRELTSLEVGLRYERYIGYIYEMNGYNVDYNGAVNEMKDLGRDLIVRKGNQVLIIQTKCWAKKRSIREKHIFQLYGTKEHFNLTSSKRGLSSKAVLYTSYARFSGQAIEVAQDLGVELKTEKLNNFYPKVKCKVSPKKIKTYHLPFDPGYDSLSVDPKKGEFFAYTVAEAFEKGHRRPSLTKDAA